MFFDEFYELTISKGRKGMNKMKRKMTICGVVLTALLIGLAALVFNVHSAAAAHIWPMFRHDLEHTGRSPYNGAQASNLVWACELSAGVRGSSPAIAQDGTIYIGTIDGNLHAVDPNTGTVIWSYSIGGNVYSSPAIGLDGTIYIGSWRETGSFGTGAVYAINPNGSLKWRYPDIGYIDDIESSPAIDPESGVIYVGGSVQHPWDGRMYAIYPNGDPKCEFFHNTSGWITASPAIRNDGMIIIGDYSNPNGRMWAIDPADCSIHDFVEVPNPGGGDRYLLIRRLGLG